MEQAAAAEMPRSETYVEDNTVFHESDPYKEGWNYERYNIDREWGIRIGFFDNVLSEISLWKD